MKVEHPEKPRRKKWKVASRGLRVQKVFLLLPRDVLVDQNSKGEN
jgi:hypothetical protein